jgi:hypothetical protein
MKTFKKFIQEINEEDKRTPEQKKSRVRKNNG